MSKNHGPSPSSYAEKYREIIRVGFDWERFFQENWPVELVVIDSPEALARCFLPWYIGPKGEEVAYDDPNAVPMSLVDVPKAMNVLNEERRNDIQKYVDEFRAQKGVIEFEVPTYALPDDQYFVLDGNHRLSALTLNNVQFKVTLWNVCGPLDPDCLLDLTYWTLDRQPSDRKARRT